MPLKSDIKRYGYGQYMYSRQTKWLDAVLNSRLKYYAAPAALQYLNCTVTD